MESSKVTMSKEEFLRKAPIDKQHKQPRAIIGGKRKNPAIDRANRSDEREYKANKKNFEDAYDELKDHPKAKPGDIVQEGLRRSQGNGTIKNPVAYRQKLFGIKPSKKIFKP